MQQINTILAALPNSDHGFWNEVISIQSKPHLIAIVRKKGDSLSSPTDLAIINLEPDQSVELTKEDIHQIACNYQKRVIPEFTHYKENNWHTNNPDFNMAYHSVMSCIDANKIYVDSSIITKLPKRLITPYGMFQPEQRAEPNIAKMIKIAMDDGV